MRVLLAVLVAFLLAPAAPAHAAGTGAEVVLLIGQSNMFGTDSTAPLLSVDARVWFWTGHRDGLLWWPAVEPLYGAGYGYGPGVDFGKHLLAIRPEVGAVMLIPCAHGGTSERWVPGGDAYARCLAYATDSGLRPTGVLYNAGQDAVTLAAADAWPAHFAAMVSGFRAEYGNIPVVHAQAGRIGEPHASFYPHWDRLKHHQTELSLPRVAMVKTDDLPLVDGVHLAWYSQMAVGQRMARAYAGLLG